LDEATDAQDSESRLRNDIALHGVRFLSKKENRSVARQKDANFFQQLMPRFRAVHSYCSDITLRWHKPFNSVCFQISHQIRGGDGRARLEIPKDGSTPAFGWAFRRL
jgi:hypothetical protein